MINAAVFIGRFQPFHNGHLHTLNTLLCDYDQVIVVLGSHNTLRSLKNPWTSSEREYIIRQALRDGQDRKISFHWQEDRPGENQKWASEIVTGVKQRIWSFSEPTQITLSGHYKDESTFYLKLFPEWPFEPVTPSFIINATDIRTRYFCGDLPPEIWIKWADSVPASTFNMLWQFKQTNLYKELFDKVI